MKTYTTYLLTALCTLLIFSNLHSQPSETYLTGIRGSSITAGKQLSIADPMPNTGTKPMPLIRVVLRWAEDRSLLNPTRVIKVPYKIILKAADGSTSSVGDVVTVNYDIVEAYTDIHVRQYEQYVSADLIIEEAGLSASIPDDVILELQACFDRYTTPASLSAPQNVKGSVVPDKNRLLITWDFLPGAESYDLDFLFIDNPKLVNNIPYDFRNATRVNVSGNHYEVSLSYPKGSILYRVRGVGKLLLSGAPDHPVYGAWNFPSEKGNILPAVNSSIRFDYSGLERDLNWQYTAAYAEDGKRKEVITFFDGTLRNRQQVTVGNTQETAIVAETFYDHIGRAALQSIPAPTPGAGIRYYGQNGTPDGNFNGYFSKSVYDTDYGVTHTLPFSTVTGSGKYYSPGNPFLWLPNQVNVAHIPETYGFTYSRQRFLNDGTDRVHSSGNPGEQFGLGSGHETKFYYGTPLQPELDRLFGNEVGEARHYQKKITVDPNGTATIEYLDMKERVIATSLAGGGDNLLEVDMTPDAQSLSEHTVFDSTQTTVTRDILVTAPSIKYTFRYRFDPAKPLCDNCAGETGCVDCYYKVTFLLRDNESMEYVFREERVTNSVVNLSYTKTLDIGSYQLLKKVEVYEEPVESFWEAFAARQQHCVDFVPVEPEPCLSECEKYCKDFCTDDGGDDCYAQCLHACENPPVDSRSECQVKYAILKNDMSLGGQYYDNRRNLCPLDTTPTPYNPDARNEFLLGIKISCLEGDTAIQALLQEYHISPPDYGALFDSMRVNWKSAYGDIMVKYHPEYDLYLYFCECNKYGNDFAYYDSLLFNIDYKEAAELGLLNPLGSKYDPDTHFTPEQDRCYQPYPETGFIDPRFDEKTSCCKESKNQIGFIRRLLEQYLSWKEKGKSVYASVWYVLHDPDEVAQGSGAITDPQVVEYITQIQTVVLPQYAEIYGSLDNAKWVFFRSLYLGMRQATMAQFMKECMNRKYYYCQENPLATGQQDWFAGQFPYELLKEQSGYYLAVDTVLCRNVPLTREGFQVRYLYNPVYSLTGSMMDDMAAQAEQDVMDNCLSECEANADGWLRQLDDYISVACPFWQDPAHIHYLRDRLVDLCMEGCHENPTADQLINLEAYHAEMNKYCKLDQYPNYPLIVYPGQPNLLECGCETFQLQLNAYDLTFWSPIEKIIEALAQDDINNAEYAGLWIKFCTKGLYEKLLEQDYDTTVWNTILFPEEFRCADPTDTDWLKQCELLSKMSAAAQNAQLRAAATEEAVQAQKQKYAQHCIQNIYDEMTISCENGEFLFTLYYYDQADNLIKTVPPKGVNVITDAVTLAKVQQYRLNPEGYEQVKPGFVHPAHTMITNYRYNSLNQLIYSRQPDHEGEIITFYDALARPVISQNAKQKAAGKYSYTIYDAIGRIIEVGELHNYFPMTTAIAYNATALNAYISSSTRAEVTRTFYDRPLKTIPDFDQQYLRNRIAAVTYSDLYHTDSLLYTTATHYSYDVHGNVQTLVQNISQLANYDREYIFIDYRYDLVSGNVNKVLYQPGKPEQFIHRYRYDSDNRITHAITSKDGIIWETEARYFYYPHGALARTELGQKQVQGTDYAYTLQGWTKAVNSYKPDNSIDIGKDGNVSAGNLNRRFATDAMSYSLQYFRRDYQPVYSSGSTVDYIWSYDLFNGNIAAMTTGLMRSGGSLLDEQVKVFRYDKLNRIKEMQTAQSVFLPADFRFATDYTYDFNGNLLSLQRKDQNESVMHRIHYTYSAIQNRLNGIDATGISNSTYKYDPVGNLTDDMGEHLTIAWNSSGKVTSVSGSAPVNFAYSPLGQRQVKGRITDNMKAYDFYIHDATGNIMAIYNLMEQAGSFMLTEEHIYGSGRLGIYKRNVTLTPENEIFFTRGIKNYELSNHLGNVNTVISDRKRQINVLGSYLADIKSYMDYYPFGYQMAERTWQSDAYRFGFNDQEKDDEIYGEGNSTTAEFWQYDTRLGRRWNVDPKSDISISLYTCFGNNPICFSDIFGDTLDIGTNKQSSKDIYNLASVGNRKYISITNNRVSLNFGNMTSSEKRELFEADAGLELLQTLTTSEEKLLYEAYDYALVRNESNEKWALLVDNRTNGTIVASNGGTASTGAHPFRPKEGYDGQVIIHPNVVFFEDDASGNKVEKPRHTVVFHELAESYYRAIGIDYKYSNGKPGAHELSKTREGNWNRKSKKPGAFYMPQIPGFTKIRIEDIKKIFNDYLQ